MERRSRRDVFKVGGAAALSVGLAACATPPATDKPAATRAPVVAQAQPTIAPTVQRTTAPAAQPTAVPAPTQAAQAPRPSVAPDQRTLVMIQLGGGDDGLNFLPPYGDGTYYDLRPKVAIEQANVLPLDGQVGLHPSLKAFKRLHDEGKLALIQGVRPPHTTLMPSPSQLERA